MIPVFIGGTGRSGTTILRRILTNHSQIISFPRELRVIADPDGAIDLMSALTSDWTPYKADKAIHRFLRLMQLCDSYSFWGKPAILLRKLGISSRPYAGMGFGEIFGRRFYRARISKLLDDIVSYKSRGSWVGSEPYMLPAYIYEAGPFKIQEISQIIAGFFQDLYSQLTSNNAETHWVEDTPENLLNVQRLKLLFPNMRFIHIFRDPRDVVASYSHRLWGGDNLGIIARRVSQIMNEWLHIRSQLSYDEYFEISLEELAGNPERNLERICEYIGLPMTIKVSETQLDREKVHSGRWRQEFNQEDVESTNRYLIPIVEAFGY